MTNLFHNVENICSLACPNRVLRSTLSTAAAVAEAASEKQILLFVSPSDIFRFCTAECRASFVMHSMSKCCDSPTCSNTFCVCCRRGSVRIPERASDIIAVKNANDSSAEKTASPKLEEKADKDDAFSPSNSPSLAPVSGDEKTQKGEKNSSMREKHGKTKKQEGERRRDGDEDCDAASDENRVCYTWLTVPSSADHAKSVYDILYFHCSSDCDSLMKRSIVNVFESLSSSPVSPFRAESTSSTASAASSLASSSSSLLSLSKRGDSDTDDKNKISPTIIATCAICRLMPASERWIQIRARQQHVLTTCGAACVFSECQRLSAKAQMFCVCCRAQVGDYCVMRFNGEVRCACERCFDEKRVCFMCGKSNNLFSCGKCRSTRYCSRDCQKAHWPKHKEECVLPSRARDAQVRAMIGQRNSEKYARKQITAAHATDDDNGKGNGKSASNGKSNEKSASSSGKSTSSSSGSSSGSSSSSSNSINSDRVKREKLSVAAEAANCLEITTSSGAESGSGDSGSSTECDRAKTTTTTTTIKIPPDLVTISIEAIAQNKKKQEESIAHNKKKQEESIAQNKKKQEESIAQNKKKQEESIAQNKKKQEESIAQNKKKQEESIAQNKKTQEETNVQNKKTVDHNTFDVRYRNTNADEVD